MNLHEVNRGIQKKRKRKRLGRGTGSGRGKTSCRGHKGQKSRPGFSSLLVFEGGGMPLVRRIPKRGFNNKFARNVAAVNVGDLEATFDAGAEVNPSLLKEKALATKRYDILKILGDGELTKALKVSAHRFSQSAKEKIEKAGGEVIILPGPTPVEEKKASEANGGVSWLAGVQGKTSRRTP